MLRNDTLFFALAAETAALHFVARRLSDRLVSLEAHLLSCAVALWLGGRLLLGGALGSYSGVEEAALLNARTAVDLAIIALGFASSVVVMRRRLDLAYRISSHAALLALLWRGASTAPPSFGAVWQRSSLSSAGSSSWTSPKSTPPGALSCSSASAASSSP
jgi:hypothetical protein